MVFDGIIGSTGQNFGDFSPTIAIINLSPNYEPIFFSKPWVLANGRIQLIFEPLSTLLAAPALESSSNDGPLPSAMNANEAYDGLIFPTSPWPARHFVAVVGGFVIRHLNSLTTKLLHFYETAQKQPNHDVPSLHTCL